MSGPISLDYWPRPWQKECHAQRKRFTVLALHRRAGKTELALMELIDKAIKSNLELPFYAYIAPFLKQAKGIAWARLKRRLEPLRKAGTVEISEGELQAKFRHNGAIIGIFGADNPDALRGMRLDGVCLDEVGQIEPYVWEDIVQPALSDRLGWALFIGTPMGVNLFSELFYRAPTLPDWHAARYTVYDTNAIAKEEVERLRTSGAMSETSFAREYLCDFSAAGDDQLISLADAEGAAHKVYSRSDIAHAARILALDPARFGDDRSVVVQRQGLVMFPPLVFRGMDNMELAARMASIIEDWQPDAVFIDQGAGSGVIDRLRQLGFRITEVAFGSKAIDPQLFINRRTEMWWKVREWLQQGGAIPNDNSLKQELATPIYWFDAQNRRVLEPKDEIKKRLQGGASPDIADALALTFAAPVRPKPQAVEDRLRTLFGASDQKMTQYEGHDPLDLAFGSG